jgi:hypothetical protein
MHRIKVKVKGIFVPQSDLDEPITSFHTGKGFPAQSLDGRQAQERNFSDF